MVEGQLEEAVTPKLLAAAGIAVPPISNKHGGARFWADAPRINRTARSLPVFGLVDLEQAECAGALIGRHLGGKPVPGFTLRIAVRMVESWLMADAESMATALGVNRRQIPARPDLLQDPKRELTNLARRSRRIEVRSALVPSERSGARVGPGYLKFMRDYVQIQWRPVVAAERSPSLERALRRLHEAKEAG